PAPLRKRQPCAIGAGAGPRGDDRDVAPAIALSHARPILGRRQAGVPLEAAREVTLVAEAGCVRDLAQACRTDELTARELDAQLPHIGGDRGLMLPPERAL